MYFVYYVYIVSEFEESEALLSCLTQFSTGLFALTLLKHPQI